MSETIVNKNRANTFNNKTDLPPFYPNGWIPVLESRNLLKSEIKSIITLGHELVVFRGNSGKVHVMDAFCPHLGANLGVGGKVVNDCGQDCIRCPFHGWTFRGKDGSCNKVPGLESDALPKTSIKVWTSIERNGIIFVWHHSIGEKPEWWPLRISEIEQSKWIYRGRTEHTVNCHFQEIPENGADVAHLQELHVAATFAGNVISKMPFYDLLTKCLYFEWDANWSACSEPDRHMTNISLNGRYILFGYPFIVTNFSIQQIGPALVHLKFKSPFLGEVSGAFIQIITPLEPNKHRIIHQLYTEPGLRAALFSKFALNGEARMIERDIIIWNNKKFLKNPTFTKRERSLVKFRRWFNQFYSENNCKKLEW